MIKILSFFLVGPVFLAKLDASEAY